MRIKMLDPHTIDQIAAGEVILRPVSVIKELVENAIDAGATRISVSVEGGGKKKMVIWDNGCGIPYNEVPLAFERHATSKLSTIGDLQQIQTLGFRGEALASVAAVARVQTTTRFETEEIGSETLFEGGKLINQRVCGHDRGTVMTVSDLFYNVPARQKHLGNAKTEAALVQDMMEKLAMSHPEIAVTYQSDGKRVFGTTGSGKLLEVLQSLLGRSFCDKLIPLDSQNEPMRLTGYIGDLSAMRGTRDLQFFFLNGRTVKNKGLSRSFEEAYTGYLMQHRHPVGVIFMELPGRFLDVNIHPAKTDIAILNQSLIDILFKQGIRETLRGSDLSIAIGDGGDEEASASDDAAQPAEAAAPRQKPLEEQTAILPAQTRTPEVKKQPEATAVRKPASVSKGSALPYSAIQSDVSAEAEPVTREESAPFEKQEPSKIPPAGQVDFSNAQIIGQLFNTFILLEQGDEAILIDQHAAHEAMMYEELRDRFERREGFPSQQLMVPQPVKVEPRVIAAYETMAEELQRDGFDCDVFGDDTLMVRSVPVILGVPQEAELIAAFLEGVTYDSEQEKDRQIQRIITMSCKAAVKGNQHLSGAEIRALLKQMTDMDNPYTCPHGRPVIFHLKKYELEKLFKRVV
jgi:DNA mismatch repair protein MutL